MRVSRRSFLKLAAAAGMVAAWAVGEPAAPVRRPWVGAGRGVPALARSTGQAGRPRRWVMVVDLAKCDGCQECTRACTAMHRVPPGQEWIRVYEMRDEATGLAYWLPRPCMQCDNPPCVKVCPVSATWKRDDGIVMQDTSRCIGCRYCIAACPYQARAFNWLEPAATP
ncbi:MAG: 4Fe-4S dicluster domain-containing protein, partial [Armatimonadota bacterium]|nr:4Fe-4S dicluster domain-containing protein [Armatimonadota bacterium]